MYKLTLALLILISEFFAFADADYNQHCVGTVLAKRIIPTDSDFASDAQNIGRIERGPSNDRR